MTQQGLEPSSRELPGAAQTDAETRFRELSGFWRGATLVVAITMSLFHIYVLGIRPIDPWTLANGHLLLGALLTFMWIPSGTRDTRSVPWWDIVAMVAVLGTFGYVQWEMEALLSRGGAIPVPLDILFGSIAILLIVEMNRRLTGWVLPIIVIVALLYAKFGYLFPGQFGHRGYSWERIVSYLFGLDGIFSQPLQVSATYVFLFLLFGAFLATSGAGQYFIDLAMSLFGRVRGGPAKVAVIASALFGSISGSAVANTASTGAFTIPLMKRVGYSRVFAPAVEAAASAGGQIMPPVMGAAAFILADIVGMSYWAVAIAATIPALLFFVSVFISVDIEAVKHDLIGLPGEQLPSRALLLGKSYLLVPLVTLVFVLAVLQMSPIRAALLSIVAAIIVSWFSRSTALGPRRIADALAKGPQQALSVLATCAAAGMVVGVLGLTGVGQILAAMLVDLGSSSVLLALMCTMFVCLVLGMGLPTTPAYIVAASVVGAALVDLGLPILGAHLFIFYFACMAVITPPIALGSYTAAGIAGADPMRVGVAGIKLGAVAFIIPYMFVYSPALLAQGSLPHVLGAAITALVGVYALASGLQGYYFGRIGWLPRVVLVLAALTLIKPGLLTDIAGVGLLALAYLLSMVGKRKTSPVSDAPESHSAQSGEGRS